MVLVLPGRALLRARGRPPGAGALMSSQQILEYARTIAVVGASRDSGKPSGHIPYILQHRGFRIIPINPHADEILGERTYASLLDVKEQVDVVDVFRPAAEA